MNKATHLISLIILLSLGTAQLKAWYPDYTVMATEFPVRKDFLRPLSIHSAAMMGMGEYFQYLYKTQPDFRFIDPTYPLGDKTHFLYMDLGSQQLWESGEEISPSYAIDYGMRTSSYVDYAFWSPYRDLSHEKVPEPSLRLFYLNRLGSDQGALTIGGSYSLSYDETQFYQPYNFNYFWGTDALGAEYARDEAYDDYRLRETGEDESISTEHQLNLFISKAISQRLTVGARLGVVNARVDGNYRNFQYNDQFGWSDEYENYWDDDLERIQTTSMTDINLGIAYTSQAENRFALNGGIINGSLDRTFNEMDTSRYLSISLNPDGNATTVDSNIYRSVSYYKSDKAWLYEGSGYYVRFLAELPKDETLMFRYGGLAEWRSADLTESENMIRRSNYFNQYYAHWDDVWRNYSSISRVNMDREGTGSYKSSFYQLSGGVEWQLQPALNFYGGLYMEHYNRSQDAREPFTGYKYAYTSTDGYGYPYQEHESTQNDVKTFAWQQEQWRTVIAVPLGIEYKVLPAIGLQAGLTKVFRRMRIEESYDVIVDQYHLVEIEDGVTTRDETDNPHVDGYEYPTIKDFSNNFDFNAGLNIRSGDKLRVSVVLTRAFQEEYAIKVGGSLSW